MVTKILYETFIVPPVFFHFHTEFKKYLFLKEGLHIQSGFPPYLFQSFPFISYEDPFLTFTFHINQCADTDQPGVFFERFNLHLHRIGNLLFVEEKDLFPDHFPPQRTVPIYQSGHPWESRGVIRADVPGFG